MTMISIGKYKIESAEFKKSRMFCPMRVCLLFAARQPVQSESIILNRYVLQNDRSALTIFDAQEQSA